MKQRVKLKVRRHQVYRSKKGLEVEIIGKGKQDKWLARILTEKQGVYAGSHTLSEHTLRYNFIKLSD